MFWQRFPLTRANTESWPPHHPKENTEGNSAGHKHLLLELILMIFMPEQEQGLKHSINKVVRFY